MLVAFILERNMEDENSALSERVIDEVIDSLPGQPHLFMIAQEIMAHMGMEA